MRKIIETLLEEGIDESMIHRVLDLIEEEYVSISEVSKEYLTKKENQAKDKAARFLVRSIVLGRNEGNKYIENLNRKKFDKANERIKQFQDKVKSYLNKKEGNKNA